MTRQLTAFAMTFTLFLMLALRASAQTATCLPEQDMTAALASRFEEHPLATALTGQGVLLSVYVGATGSWTITLTRPGGSACIVAAGDDFSLLHRDGRVPGQPT